MISEVILHVNVLLAYFAVWVQSGYAALLSPQHAPAQYAPPTIHAQSTQEEFQHPRYFPQGGNVTFVCSATGYPKPIYVWFRNDSPIRLLDDRITLSHGNLTLSKLDYEFDDGIYQCLVVNKHGADVSKPIMFKTQVIGDFLYPNQKKDEEKIIMNGIIGKSLSLQCPTTSYFNPKIIYWGYKTTGSAFLRIHEDTRVNVLLDGSLFYGALENEDVDYINRRRGLYCVIYSGNEFRPSKPIFLKVTSDAVMLQKTPNIEVIENAQTRIQLGKIVRFQCLVKHRSPPMLSWYFNGELMDNSFMYAHKILYGGTLLELHAQSSEMSGIYSCKAMSTLKDESFSTEVIHPLLVHGDPEWSVQPRDQFIEKYGTVKLGCLASSPSPVKYQWIINERSVNLDISYEVHAERFIFIRNITQMLNIKCHVTNKESSITASLQIHIIDGKYSSNTAHRSRPEESIILIFILAVVMVKLK